MDSEGIMWIRSWRRRNTVSSSRDLEVNFHLFLSISWKISYLLNCVLLYYITKEDTGLEGTSNILLKIYFVEKTPVATISNLLYPTEIFLFLLETRQRIAGAHKCGKIVTENYCPFSLVLGCLLQNIFTCKILAHKCCFS